MEMPTNDENKNLFHHSMVVKRSSFDGRHTHTLHHIQYRRILFPFIGVIVFVEMLKDELVLKNMYELERFR